MADMVDENVIEFIKGQKIATVTFSQRKYITRIKKLAEQRPEACQIVAENEDGSILAHIPTSWVRINPSKVMSEKEKEELVERFKNSHRKAKKKP